MLGEGSFCTVYRAGHKASKAEVAVKVIPTNDDEFDKIKGEIDILSRCDSPYIVGYFEFFIKNTPNKPAEMWMVMEYCEGGRMSDLLELGSVCRNIPHQDTLRDVTGYKHCRFVVKSLTQTAIDSIVDSLVLLFVVDFSLRKISFQLL